MEAKRCERCGARKSKPDAGSFDLLDYCAKCARDLCDACMAKGCCGHVPAISGGNEDANWVEAEVRRVRRERKSS